MFRMVLINRGMEHRELELPASGDETFRLVIPSFLIRRHGAGLLEAEGSYR